MPGITGLNAKEVLEIDDVCEEVRNGIAETLTEEGVTDWAIPVLTPTHHNTDVDGSLAVDGVRTDFTHTQADLWEDIDFATTFGIYDLAEVYPGVYVSKGYDKDEYPTRQALVVNPPEYLVSNTI